MINLIANSAGIGVRIPGTHHAAFNKIDADIIREAVLMGQEDGSILDYANGYSSFYYPADLGRYLWSEFSIPTRIEAHSGRIVVNGEYMEGE